MTFFESSSRFSSLLAHDLFRKPYSPSDQVRGQAFRDHALDRTKRPRFAGRQFYPDVIPGLHVAAADHDRHHTGLAHETTLRIAPEHRRHQPGLKRVELAARIAQPGHLDHRLRPEA